MGKGHHIRCFDYVNHRYAQVRDALQADASGALHRATKRAADHADSVAAQLRVHVAGMEVVKDIDLAVGPITEKASGDRLAPVTHIQLEWKAHESSRLFPTMHAELLVYPLTATETQLDLSGHYEPPLGLLGNAVDAVVGHRIAEASVRRFLNDLADYFREMPK